MRVTKGATAIFAFAVVLVPLLLTSLALAFPDVPTTHPYAQAIDELASRNVIAGFEDGTFGPDRAVWRSQFAKMIVGALQIPVNETLTSPFADLGPDNDTLYPHEYVAAAYAAGITTGRTATAFDPWTSINRAQVITMVVRAVRHQYPDLLYSDSGPSSTWGDFDPIHGPNAAIAETHGLLDGLPIASLRPWDPMPRGEVAQVLANAIHAVESSAPTTTSTTTTTEIPTTTTTTEIPTTTTSTEPEVLAIDVTRQGFRTEPRQGGTWEFIAAAFELHNSGNTHASFGVEVYALDGQGMRRASLGGGVGVTHPILAPGETSYVYVNYGTGLSPGTIHDVEMVLTPYRSQPSTRRWLVIDQTSITTDWRGAFAVNTRVRNTSNEVAQRIQGAVVLGNQGTPIAVLGLRSAEFLYPGESVDLITDYAPGENSLYAGLSVIAGFAWAE